MKLKYLFSNIQNTLISNHIKQGENIIFIERAKTVANIYQNILMHLFGQDVESDFDYQQSKDYLSLDFLIQAVGKNEFTDNLKDQIRDYLGSLSISADSKKSISQAAQDQHLFAVQYIERWMWDDVLPNQHKTWEGIEVQDYMHWLFLQEFKYASHAGAMVSYVSTQIDQMEACGPLDQNMLAYHRLQEFKYALLHFQMTSDTTLCLKAIQGIRLNTKLHPEYVERTNCYGEQSDLDHAKVGF